MARYTCHLQSKPQLHKGVAQASAGVLFFLPRDTSIDFARICVVWAGADHFFLLVHCGHLENIFAMGAGNIETSEEVMHPYGIPPY
jgi:hypothetical protein